MASRQNKISSGIIFLTFSKVQKYEIKYRTKICDFTVGCPIAGQTL